MVRRDKGTTQRTDRRLETKLALHPLFDERK